MRFFEWSIVLESLRDFRRTWPQLVVTDLLSRALAIVIIAPAAGVLGKIFLWRASGGVVTDEQIVTFLLHPFGLIALVVVAAVSLGVLFAEVGQLLVIGFGATEERRVTWLDAFLYSYRHGVSLIRLALAAVVRLLLIAAPFLASLGLIFWMLVRTHDINYYLARKPPEFILAMVAAGALLVTLSLLVVWKIAGWLFSVPMVLFERMGGRQSLKASAVATAPYRRSIALWLLGWAGVAALAMVGVTRGVGLLAYLAVSQLADLMTPLLTALSIVIVVGVLAYLGVLVFLTAVFSLFVVRLYRSTAGPGRLQPEIAPRGSLGGVPSLRIPAKRALAAAFAFVVIVVVGLSIAVDDPGWMDSTQIIAHRGGAWVAPENTIAAFERAIVGGADWIELDVQENADGEVVVQHDRDFMRAAGVALEVWRATDEDLSGIDIGGSFAPEFSDQRVPSLREVLELAKGRVGVFIELKYYGHDVSLEQKVVELVEEAGMASDIVIMSLDYDGVRKTAGLRPDWTFGLLNAVSLGDLTHLDVDFLALTASASKLSMVRRTHGRDKKIYPWTINDPVQMWMMMSRGADGIITDRVALANDIKELRAQVTPVGRFIIWIAGEIGLLRGMDETSSEEDA